MSIQQNKDFIQTTHIGSLPRPHDLLDMMKAKFSGEAFDQAAFDISLAQAVKDSVAKQVACGIDIVTDGEFSKPGFFTYVQERLEGYELRPSQKLLSFQKEIAAFPEYYKQYMRETLENAVVRVRRSFVSARSGTRATRWSKKISTTSRPQRRQPASPMTVCSCRRPQSPASASTNTTSPRKTSARKSCLLTQRLFRYDGTSDDIASPIHEDRDRILRTMRL